MPKDKGKGKEKEKEKEKDKKKGSMFNRSKTKTKSFDVPPLPNKPDINTQSSQQSQWAWSVELPAAIGGNQDYEKLLPQDREEMLKIKRANDQVSVISYIYLHCSLNLFYFGYFDQVVSTEMCLCWFSHSNCMTKF